MVEPTADPEVREALTELDLYLSDTLPPLVVAGSAEVLLRHPPQIVAAAIRSWTGGQYGKGGAGASVSDYLFHAIKKIHMLGEFRLVPRETLEGYLAGLKTLVLADCPEEDRGLLAENLARLSETAAAATAAPVASLHRQAAPKAASSAAAPAEEQASRRRFDLFLQRLESQARAAAGAPSAPAAIAETLAAAARGSQSSQEIEGYLTRLREMGMQVGTADVFKALSSSLPAWVMPSAAAWQSAPASPSVDAMRRMVAEAADPLEGGRRFQELVRAAIDRFNEGSLPQAVSTLEAADRLIAEKKVDPGTVEIVRRKGDETLDTERLKAAAENPAQHPALRKLLSFFSALTPEGLLDQLGREDKRERRRILLALLEVHGPAAREAAFEGLAAPFRDISSEEWYLRRNLLYLMRKIPRPADTPIEPEVDVTVRYTELRFPPPLLREAVANLGTLRHDKSETALRQLLSDLEAALKKPTDVPAESKELLILLDRVAAALARLGTPGARRALLDHGMGRDPKLGDTAARLAELSGQDFSEDGELVGRILETIKTNLPFKLFGLALHQNDQILHQAIGALSGTPTPPVRAAFEEISSRFPDKEIGKAAARALAGFRKAAAAPAAPAPAAAAASLTGDLDVFGLPALLQSLSDSGVSGALTLRDPRGEVFGALRLRGGKLRACQSGALSGEDAFYQLLERPAPGQFQFLKTADAAEETGTGSLKEILPLTLEAMRRHDELKQASVLVPDDARLKATDVRPSPHPGEKDGMLQKTLWSKVSRGATPRECEAEVRTDAYRIRRLLAHWVEQGALAPDAP